MSRQLASILVLVSLTLAVQAAGAAQITFYEGEQFRGRAFTTERGVENFKSFGFNDRASSVEVSSGRWEVCEDSRFTGHCVVLRPGAYDSLKRMGLNDRVTSVRLADYARTDYGNDSDHEGNDHHNSDRNNYADGPVPLPSADYQWRRRPNEQVYKARVTSVRAVVGPADRHCWVDRQQVRERSGPNVGGAVVGAVIGGILGHQIGSGNGRDVATVGGAVVGGAIGANVNRDHEGNTYERNVRRCETRTNDDPDYWDVAYKYRGRTHYVQMTAPPGNYIYVNRNGEPRQ